MAHTNTLPLIGPAGVLDSRRRDRDERAASRPAWILQNTTAAYVTRSVAVTGIAGAVLIPLAGLPVLILCVVLGMLSGLVLGKENPLSLA